MLEITSSASHPLILVPKPTSPLVYLDYGIIKKLAKDDLPLGQEVRDCILDSGGTLYLSLAHFAELSGIPGGPTYSAIRSYLASFGQNFLLIDFNPKDVIKREEEWSPGKQNPAFFEDLWPKLVQKWNGLSELTLSILLDDVFNDPSAIDRLRFRTQQFKNSVKKEFDIARDKYQNDHAFRGQMDTTVHSHQPRTPPTKYIYHRLRHECVITHEQFKESDAFDFAHSVVSLAYCEYVILDRKWANRCNKIALPPDAARVFKWSQVNDFLKEIKHQHP